jgi:cephalosporin hydroxylase
MAHDSSYFDAIPNSEAFNAQRTVWQEKMAEDHELRSKAVELTISADNYKYGYQWQWCGVPIIRHPDDIVLQQEIVFDIRPACIVETGIARGGSLVLSSTLLKMLGLKSKVLGIDIKVFQHAKESLRNWLNTKEIEILECDSTSDFAKENVIRFLGNTTSPSLLILDSDHSGAHVSAELANYSELLAIGSIIMVADTIIEEMPSGYYSERTWGKGDNPLTAVNNFLRDNNNWQICNKYSRRSLMGECRDGILIKVN